MKNERLLNIEFKHPSRQLYSINRLFFDFVTNSGLISVTQVHCVKRINRGSTKEEMEKAEAQKS